MLFNDIYAQRIKISKLPFIVYRTGNIYEAVVYPIDENEFYYEDEMGGLWATLDQSAGGSNTYALSDYFDPQTATPNCDCKCSTRDLMMQGCVCGSIKRYQAA